MENLDQTDQIPPQNEYVLKPKAHLKKFKAHSTPLAINHKEYIFVLQKMYGLFFLFKHTIYAKTLNNQKWHNQTTTVCS